MKCIILLALFWVSSAGAVDLSLPSSTPLPSPQGSASPLSQTDQMLNSKSSLSKKAHRHDACMSSTGQMVKSGDPNYDACLQAGGSSVIPAAKIHF